MCNFIMYHTEIEICHKPKQIATKKATEKRQMWELIVLLSLKQINAGNFWEGQTQTQRKEKTPSER